MATTVSSLEHKTNVEFNNLRIKLQNQLKKDIFRLYSDSVFADLSIYVENEAIKLHSCILQTRAPAFYSFYCQKPDLIKFVPCHKLKIFFKEIYYASEIKSKEDELLKCIESAFSIDKPLSLEGSSDFELSHYFNINDSFFGTSTPKLHLLRDLSKSSSCVSVRHLRNNDNTAYYSLVDESLVLSDFSDINEDPSRGMNKRNELSKSASWEMNGASRDPAVSDEPAQWKHVTTKVDSSPKVDLTPKAVVEHINIGDLLHDAKKAPKSDPPARKLFSSDGDQNSNNCPPDRVRKFFIDASDLIDEDAANGGEKIPPVTESCEPQTGPSSLNEGPKSPPYSIPSEEIICEKTRFESTCAPFQSKNQCEENEVETSCTVLLRNAKISDTSQSTCNEKWNESVEISCNVVLRREKMHEVPVESILPPENHVKLESTVESCSNSPFRKEKLCEEQTPDSLDDDPPNNECDQHTPAELRNKLENDFLRASLTETEQSCDPISSERSQNPIPQPSRDPQSSEWNVDPLTEWNVDPSTEWSVGPSNPWGRDPLPAPRSCDPKPASILSICDPVPAQRSQNPIPAQVSHDPQPPEWNVGSSIPWGSDPLPAPRSCDPKPAEKSCDPLPAPRSCNPLPAPRSFENENHSVASIPAISFDIFKTYLMEKYDCARKNHAYSDDELQRLKVFDELVSQDSTFTYVKCDLEEMIASGATKLRIAMHKFLVKQYEKHHKSTYSSVKSILKDFLKQQAGSEPVQSPDSLNEDERYERLDDVIVAEVDELFKKLLKLNAAKVQQSAEPVTSRSCGFFIDLKESPKPRSEAKEKSLPSKQLFSMFIDFGASTDSDSSLEVQNRLERRKKQYISKLEKSRELRNSATSLNEVEPVVGRKLEKIVQSTPLSCSVVSEKSTDEVKSIDTSTVVMRRSKKTNGTPHPSVARRSWNVDKTNEINQNTVLKHKRSYSVSAHQYEPVPDAYTVDVNLNRQEGTEFPSIGNADSTNELTVNGESEISNSQSYSEGGDARTQSSVSDSISAQVSANGDLPKSEETCSKSKEKVFVKLSDMDKEPKSLSSSQWSSVRMTKSAIGTEASWFETKLLNGSVNSRSLSRIFPDLSVSVLSKPNSDVDDTTVSSFSSVHSSSAVSTCESNLELSNNASRSDNNSLGQDLLKMFLDEISTDVVVEVTGRRIKAHKCILTSRCQYFAALLSGGWVESAGNVLSIHGFSYNVVHFALCYIYSGESEIPESINIVELASLADYLCLEGLKEVVSCTLKMKFCHFFHKPCNMCSVGVLECLPIAVNFGLDDIHRKSLRWITKHFVRLWCSKAFASLSREMIDKCYNQHVVNMTVSNVFETLTNCDKLFTLIPQTRWAEPCFSVTRKLHDFCIKYLANHFVEFLKSDAFMSIATNRTWGIIIMDEKTQLACAKMRSDQLCHSYAYISGQCKLATASHENEELIELLNRVKHQIETALVKIALQACQCSAWFQMDSELRSHIQTSAGLTFVPSEVKRRVETLKSRPSTISSGSRSVDLQQVKTAINRQHRQANNIRSHEVRSGSKQGANQKSSSHHARSTSARQNGSHGSQNKENKGASTKASSHANSKSPFRNKYANVKSRYMDKGAKNDRATASETTPSETSEAERRPPHANKRPSKSLASSVHLSPGASLRQTARAVSLSKIPVSVRNSSQKRTDSGGDTTSGSDNGARPEQRRRSGACANGTSAKSDSAAGGRRPKSHGAATNGVASRPAVRKTHVEAQSTRSTRPQSAQASRRKANSADKHSAGRRKTEATGAAPRSKDTSPDVKCPSNPSSSKTSVSEEIARPDVPFRRDGTFCIDEPTVLKKHSPTSEQAEVL